MDKPWLAYYGDGIPEAMEVPEKPLAAYLDEAAARFPKQTALIFGARVGSRLMDKTMSYAELKRQVDRFAAALQRLGIKKGHRVAVMLPNCPQYVITAYAVWRLGAALVCCNPLYTPREIEYLLNDSGAETMVVMSSVYKNVQSIRAKTGLQRIIVANIKEYFPGLLKFLFTLTKEKKEGHRLDFSADADTFAFQQLLDDAPAAARPVDVQPGDIATLIYTSGTTGRPKGAGHIHRSQAFNAAALNLWAGSRPGRDVMLAAMPFFHIYGLMVVLNTVVAGALTAVLIPNPRDMEHVLMAIQKHRINYYLGVPAMFVGFNNHPRTPHYDMSSLKFATSAAAPLAPEVQTRFEQIAAAPMLEAYGLTETIVASMNPITGARPGTIGIPLPNTDMAVVDEETGTRFQPPGTAGEIIVRGPQIMKGYWNNPAATAESIRTGPDGKPDWFFTGDIGMMDAQGYFRIVDRKNDMIIASGYNVYPAEVEAVLYEHPKVLEAAVYGVADEKRGETVKAAVVLKPGESAGEGELIDFCRQQLAAYKVPCIIEFRSELPKSLIGKVLRRVLREQG